jgi:hypothetical protein
MSTPMSPGEFLFVYTLAVTGVVFVVGAVWWNRRERAAAKARVAAQQADWNQLVALVVQARADIDAEADFAAWSRENGWADA